MKRPQSHPLKDGEVWNCIQPLLTWRFNRGVNRLSDSTFVNCSPLICTNWIYIVWECSYFFNLWTVKFLLALDPAILYILGPFKPPQSFLVTVGRSKPPQPFHPLLNWSTSLRLSERGGGGKIKWHCLPPAWVSKPKCVPFLKLKHIKLELKKYWFHSLY